MLGLRTVAALSLTSILAGDARAADAVLHDGASPASAVLRVTEVAGRRERDLRASTLTQLLEDAPVVGSGEVSVAGCTGPSVGADQVEVQRAAVRSALRRVEHAAARAEVERLLAILPCLDGPADGAAAGAALFMGGYLAFTEGRVDDARSLFRRAAGFDATMAWDDNYSPDGAPLFYEERSRVREGGGVSVRIVPGGAMAAAVVSVDGEPASVSTDGTLLLIRGEHLVQFGDPLVGMTLTVDGPGVVAVPGLADDTLLSWVLEEARWADLDALIGSGVDGGGRVYAVNGDQVRSSQVGSARWETVEPGGRLGRTVLWTGAGLTAAGGGVALLSLVQGRRAASDASGYIEAGDQAGYASALASYDSAQSRLGWSRWVGLGGAVVLGTGAVMLQGDRVGVAPLLMPGGGGAALTVRGR